MTVSTICAPARLEYETANRLKHEQVLVGACTTLWCNSENQLVSSATQWRRGRRLAGMAKVKRTSEMEMERRNCRTNRGSDRRTTR